MRRSAPSHEGWADTSPGRHAASSETLTGLVERVTFHNPDNGFCVLRVKARGQRDLITVVGHAPVISAGEFVQATGTWTNDRTHGPQFKASFLRAAPPTTLEGIERYLGSGMIRGIGPIYAKRLVRAFGEAVFDVIEEQPERLREVDGIGPKRAEKIIGGWADQKVIREIMIFLHSHGVSTSRAVRIFKIYGADAIQVLSENPYRLARDVRGIGFKTADAIAARLGIEKTAMIRARAGIGFTLTEAMDDGHCGLPLDDLVPMAEQLLEIPASIVEQALDLRARGRRGGGGHGRGPPLHLPGRAVSGRTSHRGSSQAPSGGRASLASHRSGKGNPVGRGQGRHHARREPAGRAPARSALEGPGHHRRPGGRQDHADQLYPQGARRQGHRDCAGGAHRPCRQAAQREHWPRGQDHPPPARRRSQARAASGATRRARSGAICSLSTRRRWSTCR